MPQKSQLGSSDGTVLPTPRAPSSTPREATPNWRTLSSKLLRTLRLDLFPVLCRRQAPTEQSTASSKRYTPTPALLARCAPKTTASVHHPLLLLPRPLQLTCATPDHKSSKRLRAPRTLKFPRCAVNLTAISPPAVVFSPPQPTTGARLFRPRATLMNAKFVSVGFSLAPNPKAQPAAEALWRTSCSSFRSTARN